MTALIRRYRYAGRRRGLYFPYPPSDPWAASGLFTGWEF